MFSEFFTISLLNGVSYGLLLFMLSSGLTLIFSMMGVLNFAHTSFYMLGAYLAYTISGVVGFWPALVLAPLVVFALGALFERYSLRRVHKWGHVPELLVTFGLSYLILELVQLIWGRSTVPYGLPPELQGPLFTIFGTQFPKSRSFIMLVALVMLGSVWLLLTRTRIDRWARTQLESGPRMAHRNNLHLQVPFGSGTLNVLMVHVGRRTDRERHLQTLTDTFLKLPEPAIMMGDFNTPPDDPIIRRMLASEGVEDPVGQRLPNARDRIDFILTRGVRWIDAGLVETKASDHPMVWVEIEAK